MSPYIESVRRALRVLLLLPPGDYGCLKKLPPAAIHSPALHTPRVLIVIGQEHFLVTPFGAYPANADGWITQVDSPESVQRVLDAIEQIPKDLLVALTLTKEEE